MIESTITMRPTLTAPALRRRSQRLDWVAGVYVREMRGDVAKEERNLKELRLEQSNLNSMFVATC
jgi:hypothetical protein